MGQNLPEIPQQDTAQVDNKRAFKKPCQTL